MPTPRSPATLLFVFALASFDVAACGGALSDEGARGADAGGDAPISSPGEPRADAATRADAAGDSEADGGALPRGVYPLDGTDPMLAVTDLAPLAKVLGDTPNVGLGETVHTSGGFQAAKARIVRFLIEHAGFRVLALETPRTAAEKLATYVATCNGNAKDALRSVFSVWGSAEMRDLVAWMCAWNQSHPSDPVSFYGFDVQQPYDDWSALGAFLQRAAPQDAAALTTDLRQCDGPAATSEIDYWQNHYSDPYSDAHFAACGTALDKLDTYVATNEGALIARTSREQYTLGKLAALGFRSWQGQKYYDATAHDTIKSYESRDLAMATVYETLRELKFPNAKAAIWAHSYHLMYAHDTTNDGELTNARTMGTILRLHLADAYAAVALAAYDVEINWPSVGMGPTKLPDPGDLESRLHALSRPMLFVDLLDPGLAAFLAPHTSIGVGVPWRLDIVPADHYRAVVYVDTSPPMNALFW